MTAGSHWARVRAVAASAAPSVKELCLQCAATFDGVAGASVMTTDDTGARGSPVVTDPVSARIEDLQYTLGEGPCVDAVSLGRPVLVDDLAGTAAARRWPGFAPAAAESGAAALFAFPLQVGAVQIGALSLYSRQAGTLTDEQIRSALVFADAVTLLLIPGGLDDGRHLDLGRRAVVHQATGMVAAQLRVPVDAAFARIRAYAYVQDRPLEEIARDVVQRRLRFDELKD